MKIVDVLKQYASCAKRMSIWALVLFGLFVPSVGAVTITSVAAQQRLSSNGLVDITVTFGGTASDVAKANCTFTATDSATKTALPVLHITRNGNDSGSGNVWTRNFVWDTLADVGGKRIDDVELVVELDGLGGVQLWEGGPYWAECNVGATKPEEYGLYFWWGDTVGHRQADDSFSPESCPTYGKSSSQLQSSGYIDGTYNLLHVHDAATAHLGAPWRMPTASEFDAMISACTTMWTTRGGVGGLLVMGTGAYSAKSIFIPAAGFYDNSVRNYSGMYGYCWSSTSEYSGTAAFMLLIGPDGASTAFVPHRFHGTSVRPVRESVAASTASTHLTLNYDGYKIHFDVNDEWFRDGNAGSILYANIYPATGTMDDLPYAEGRDVVLPRNKYAREGFEFVGWAKAKNYGAVYQDGATIKANELPTSESGLVLYAVWKAKTVVITLDYREWSGASQNIKTKTATTGYGVQMPWFPIVSSSSDVIDGWYTAPSGGTRVDTGTWWVPTKDTTYYLHWRHKTCTIKYNANGGTGSMPNQSFTMGINQRLSLNQFQHDGYVFGGWAKSSDGAVVYTDGEGVLLPTAIDGGTVTLYAVWTAVPKTYTVTYRPGSWGNGDEVVDTKTQGVSLKLRTALYSGWGTQVGWSTTDGGVKAYDLGASYTADANVTLYPVWRYTITYSPGQYSSGATYEQNFMDTDLPVTLRGQTYSRSGYVQTGWKDSEVDNSWGMFVIQKFELGEQYSRSASITLYPVWNDDEVTYTVTYKPGSYGSGSQRTATKTQWVGLQLEGAIFTRSGYMQTGWATSDGGPLVYALGESYHVDYDITLYPVWTPQVVAPSAPTGVSATDGSYADYARVTWSAASGATSYNLYRSTTTSRPSTATKMGVTSPYNDTTATPGTKYYYWIMAVNSAGSSVSSYDTGYRAVSLTLGKTSDQYSSSGGSGSASVTANTSWSASANASWITLGTKSGSGNGTLTYTVAANTSSSSRSGTITVTAGSGTSYPATKTIAVSQEAAAPTTYTVSFNANGGTGTMTSQTITYGVSTSLKANTFTKSGYTFAGWSKTAGGSVAYANGASVSNLAPAGGTITLYAVWDVEVKICTIVFKANGGSGTMTNQTVAYGDTVALNANEFTRSGYTFAGWARTANGAVEFANCGLTVNQTDANRTITLYAQWSPVSYRVTYSPGSSGTGSKWSTSKKHDVALKLSDALFTRAGGFAQTGWSTSDGGPMIYALGATYTDNKAITLYPTWALESNDVYTYSPVEGGVEITKYSGTAQDVYVPSVLGGGKVVGIGNQAFYMATKMRTITLPEGLEYIGNYAFWECDSLEAIDIPDSVRCVGACAFSSCSSLRTVFLGAGVSDIGRGVFGYCNSLTQICISPENLSYCVSDGVLFDATKTSLIVCPRTASEVSIPENVTNIAARAFQYCTNLVAVVLPKGITSIGDSAFQQCDKLESVVLPKGITEIGYDTFEDCDSLVSIDIPYGVTVIGSSAFYDCRSLKSVTIPSTVTNIMSSAFGDCSSLESVSLADGLTDIGSSAFRACTSLKTIRIPKTVVSIGYDAFLDCPGLGDGIVIIEGCVLTVNSGCPANVTLPSGTWLIAGSAFANQTSLKSVSMPDCVEIICDRAFEGCSSLSSIRLSNGLTKIGAGAFLNCTSLTSITLPSRLTHISGSLFKGCTTLVSVTIPDGVQSIGIWAFYGCSALSELQIPQSVVEIGRVAFYGCKSLPYYNLRYSVLFDLGVGTHTGGGALQQSVRWGDYAIMPTMTADEGFEFKGWATEAEGAVVYSKDLDSIVLAKSSMTETNINLYAVWNLDYVPAPSVSPADGATFSTDSCLVTLDCAMEGAAIYYTTNGATPKTSASYLYKQPFEIRGTVNVKAVAVKDGVKSDYVTAKITKVDPVPVETPVITPVHGTTFSTDSCEVTIMCPTDGATIYYTTDGTLPTVSESCRYKGAFSITDTATIKAIAVKEGWLDSACATVTITKVGLTLEGVLGVDSRVRVTTGGETDWVPINDANAKEGGTSARSGLGNTDDDSVSWIQLSVNGKGTLSFWCKTSCEHDDDNAYTWDRVEVTVDGQAKSDWYMDGTSQWVQRTIVFDTAAEHAVRIAYIKDESDYDGEDCAWLDGVVWTPVGAALGSLPDLGDTPSATDVSAAVADAADPQVAAKVDATNYNDFRAWAGKVKAKGGSAAGVQGVMSAENAWLSYALGQNTLLETVPTDGDLAVEAFEPTAEAGTFAFTVSVKDVEVGSEAAKENLKKVFGLEGAATLDKAAFSSDKVEIDFGTPVDGKVKFTATPKDASARAFFMKVKMLP